MLGTIAPGSSFITRKDFASSPTAITIVDDLDPGVNP